MKLGRLINHEIIIKPSANEGFIVAVGCGIFAFADKESLLSSLAEYLDDPKKWEDEYNKKVGIHEAPLPGAAGDIRDPRDTDGHSTT